MSDNAADYEFLMPFLNDSKDFRLGVEAGFLFKELDAGPEVLSKPIHPENEEYARMMASRMGYEVAKLEPWKPEGATETAWVFIELRRLT